VTAQGKDAQQAHFVSIGEGLTGEVVRRARPENGNTRQGLSAMKPRGHQNGAGPCRCRLRTGWSLGNDIRIVEHSQATQVRACPWGRSHLSGFEGKPLSVSGARTGSRGDPGHVWQRLRISFPTDPKAFREKPEPLVFGDTRETFKCCAAFQIISVSGLI
jgi:hypothetical protein